ncbi:hypothetical protein HYZ98_02005 [Candidatus Peregrinibacteria bacterium]|nr:hypothetical protein [Candidatus Peregrinibacteria bacterium]
MDIIAILTSFPDTVFALAPPPVPGMVGGASNVIADEAIPAIVDMLLRIATGISLIFLVVAGFNMMFSWGDEGKTTEARWGMIYALAGLGVAIMARMIVNVVVTEGSLVAVTDEVSLMGAALTMLVTIFNGLFTIIIVFGGMRAVFARGKPEEFNRARFMIAWSIGGAIVVNIANAAIQAVTSFFGV